jgi:tRNA nucleotidyltransferase (CCA-adding enzyme)
MESIDVDGNGEISFDEFVLFASSAEKQLEQSKSKSKTMILIGRARAGVHMKSVKLNRLFERFGGGGHAKAASATVRLNDEAEAQNLLQNLVDELVETSVQSQPTVGDFMTSPVLSVRPDMTEKQVEDLFVRYDVRALPVVDENNDVIGLVTYKEVAAAKQRLFNKEQKRRERERNAASQGGDTPSFDPKVAQERKGGTTVKGWMLQHIQIVEASKTMAEVESILLENDVGCMPVVADGTKQLVGMVTRTDLLRQHRYYPSLHYHNKGFADSIAARKPMIELRKRLKQFDLD